MNWRSFGKNVLTLGIGYLIERVVAKKVPKQLTEVISDLAQGGGDKVPPELKQALDALITAQIRDALAKVPEIGRQIEANIAKSERLRKTGRK